MLMDYTHYTQLRVLSWVTWKSTILQVFIPIKQYNSLFLLHISTGEEELTSKIRTAYFKQPVATLYTMSLKVGLHMSLLSEGHVEPEMSEHSGGQEQVRFNSSLSREGPMRSCKEWTGDISGGLSSHQSGQPAVPINWQYSLSATVKWIALNILL